MYVLGIDVGIRNLSFCLMSRDDEEPHRLDKYAIHFWELIDLLVPEASACCIADCMETGKYQSSDDFFCKTHFPKGLRAADYKRRVLKPDAQALCLLTSDRIRQIMDATPAFQRVDRIVIENQAVSTSAIKKQGQSIFTILSLLYAHNPRVTIKYTMASNKLKYFLGPPDLVPEMKDKYKHRKLTAIANMTWYLENMFARDQRDEWGVKLVRADTADAALFCIHQLRFTT